MSSIMVPSELVKEVYRAHVDHFGEPDHSIRFGNGEIKEGEEHFPPRIDVMIWRPDATLNVATFSTIGMCDRPMCGADYRAELHFAVRSEGLAEEEERQAALFLANLAIYPFHYGVQLDWWHSLRDPGKIPLFSTDMSILFHPRFVENGWDTILYDNQEVRLLNVIPITVEERQLKVNSGTNALLDLWSEQGVDIFASR